MKKILLLGLALLLCGCGKVSPQETAVPDETLPEVTQTVPETTQPAPTLSPEESLLASLTLRQKVGQLFVVRPDALDLDLPLASIEDPNSPGVTEVSGSLLDALEQYPVGGFVQFSKNITDPDQLTAFNQQLSQALPVAPFLSVDEEGGVVARLARHPAFSLPQYKSAGSVGAQGPEAATLV